MCGEKSVYVGDGVQVGVEIRATNRTLTAKGEAARKVAEAKRAEENKIAEQQRLEQQKIEEQRRIEREKELAEQKRQEEIRKAEEKRKFDELIAKDTSDKFKAYQEKFYRDDSLNVVIDPTYNLMWQDNASLGQGRYKDAQRYCENLEHAGQKGVETTYYKGVTKHR